MPEVEQISLRLFLQSPTRLLTLRIDPPRSLRKLQHHQQPVAGSLAIQGLLNPTPKKAMCPKTRAMSSQRRARQVVPPAARGAKHWQNQSPCTLHHNISTTYRALSPLPDGFHIHLHIRSCALSCSDELHHVLAKSFVWCHPLRCANPNANAHNNRIYHASPHAVFLTLTSVNLCL